MKCVTIIHIFYYELLDELSEAVKNIQNIENDTYITISENLKSRSEEIKGKFPNATLLIVSNVGYDVWPFLYVLGKINLDEYDFIVKLHTKGNALGKLKNVYIDRHEWRRRLLNFVSSKENFGKTLELFKNNHVGAVSDQLVIYEYQHDLEKRFYGKIKELMLEFGFEYKPEQQFIAGTMFMARASLFKYLQGIFSEGDFSLPDKEHTGGLPHVLERIFGYSVCAQGYKIVSYDGKSPDQEYKKNKLKNFFFQKKYTTHHTVLKILCVPVYFKKRRDL